MPSHPPSTATVAAPMRACTPGGGMAMAGLLVAIVGAMLVGATDIHAQQSPTPKAVASTAPKVAAVAKPAWRDLGTQQQKALEPLASTWDELTEPHKRKWLVIVRDYDAMSVTDQEVLHSRMKAWARLSNRERAQARINFDAVKQIPADERKAKWEAYQALSDEEKGKLAARAASTTPGAAATIRPVPAQKLAPVPTTGPDPLHAPRIQLAPPVVSTRATAPAASSAPVSAEAQVPPPAVPATDATSASTTSSAPRSGDVPASLPATAP